MSKQMENSFNPSGRSINVRHNECPRERVFVYVAVHVLMAGSAPFRQYGASDDPPRCIFIESMALGTASVV
jgi:hypothetical protein